jgi:hypothetical protein
VFYIGYACKNIFRSPKVVIILSPCFVGTVKCPVLFGFTLSAEVYNTAKQTNTTATKNYGSNYEPRFGSFSIYCHALLTRGSN